MSGPRESRTFEQIIDICIDEISMGRMSVEDALDRWPEHREELGPLLSAAFAISELPDVAEHAPDPERRADFLSAIRTTPQDAPSKERRGFKLPSLGGFFAGSLTRVATVAAPAAVIAVLAVVLTLGGGATTASASTLTVFAGAVERDEGGTWVALENGAALEVGDRLRTSGDGEALLTFADGSTAALDGATELVIEQASLGGAREIVLNQLAGRIWNDVAPGAEPVSYVVRTVDAVIEAHGTTFETLVTDEETSVVTAEGAVEVVTGNDHTSVSAGQTMRVAQQRVVGAVSAHRATAAPVTFTIDGPFVASLRSASGAATGALPNGVMFQQIAGVWSTDPGEGSQELRFFDVEPGQYEFTLRRTDGRADRAGRLTLQTPGGGRTVELPAALGSLTIRIEITDANGRLTIRILDTEPRPTPRDQAPEQIVPSPRLTDAEPVADRRAALRTDATPTTDATRATDGRTVEPNPTATSSDTDGVVSDLESRLRRVLSFEEPERQFRLRRLLEELGKNDELWLKLRQLLLGDDQLRRAFIDTVAGFESAELKAAIRERLGFDGGSGSGDTSLSTATPVAVVTATATPSTSLDSATR